MPSWNPATEQKHVIYARLTDAGLWDSFKATKQILMSPPVSMDQEKAYLEATRRYPPEYASDAQKQLAAKLLEADRRLADIDYDLKAKQLEAAEGIELSPDVPLASSEQFNDAMFEKELEALTKATESSPIDSDRDIDFAYRNFGLKSLTPAVCPSIPAWRWWVYAKENPGKFLESFAARAEKRRKESAAGAERFSDDKRQQLAALDKLSKAMSMDVEKTVLELKSRNPFEFDAAIRKAGYAANSSEASVKE